MFFELWRSASKYDPNRSLRGWLFGIARKRAIDHLRRFYAAASVTVPLDTTSEIAGLDDREMAEKRAATAVLIDAIKLLPSPPSAVLRLTYFDGYTQIEIAALLHIPLGTSEDSGRARPSSLSSILVGMGLAPVR